MPDSFLIELIQDIPEAAQFELEALNRKNDFIIERSESSFAVITGKWEVLREAAFIRKVSKILWSGDSYERLPPQDLPEGKFYVRIDDPNNCHDATLEPIVGEKLGARGRVSFKDPDFVIRMYHMDRWYLCIELFNGNLKEFEIRRAPMRPFFSPISIHPRHARFMVNISGADRGDSILDPFCGTGGIMLEAAITGKKVFGNDWSLQMATGARLNLKYFGIRDFDVRNEDFTKMSFDQEFSAIITDLPYGKNSRLSQKNVSDLYSESFRKFRQILKESGKCVIVVSDLSLLQKSEPYFDLEKVFTYRVHRSLTRYFAVLKRKIQGI